MLSWARIKTALGYLLTLVLMIATVIAVQSQSIDDDLSAEGRLSEYYGRQAVTMEYGGDGGGGGGGRPYPGDLYPGDWPPLYPGDEQWDGQYQNISRRYPSDVQSLATDGQNVYIGGENLPVYPYENPSFPLARWKENRWEQLVPGTDGELQGKIYSLAVGNNQIFAGGMLTQAGSLPVNKIAHWDGAHWDDMGGGVSGAVFGDADVQTIAVSGSNVYVGGWFTQAGSLAASNIARWDGTQWHDMGGGTDSDVKAIAVNGGNVYVGGAFTKAGSLQSANHIAVWNGQTWSALGSGTNGTVNAIAIHNNNVYVGGQFTDAGDKLVFNIARWDGSQWYPLGNGLASGHWINVKAIKATPEGIYVGGYFEPVFGNYKAYSIAFWNGSEWTNLGSGIQWGEVNSLEALDQQIFTGGQFGLAGNNWSDGFAIWNKQPAVVIYDTGSSPVAPGSTIYIYGQFFPPNQLVRLTVNGEVLSRNVPSDADGKVYIRLFTTAENPAGNYSYSLSAGNLNASGTFTLEDGAPLVSTIWSGWDFTYPPYSLYLPVTLR